MYTLLGEKFLQQAAKAAVRKMRLTASGCFGGADLSGFRAIPRSYR